MDIHVAPNATVHMMPRGTLFDRVAFELEVWAHVNGEPAAVHEYCDEGIPKGIVVDSDAGVGHPEIATRQYSTIGAAIRELEFVIGRLPEEWELEFQVKRPSEMRGHGEWVPKERYEALKRAAKCVAPQSWAGIHEMTNMACVQMNMSSSRLHATDPAMMLLMNVMNNAGPYIAARIHEDLGYGYGHLAAWNFAEEWRLPSWNHWFPSWDDFCDWFHKKPRFIVEDPPQSDDWIDLPAGQTCSVDAPVDLGTFWPCMRPKLNDAGERYWEFRPMPSMELDFIELYGLQLMSIFELIMQWHQVTRSGEPLSRNEAKDVFSYVHSFHPHLFPSAMIGKEEWEQLLHM